MTIEKPTLYHSTSQRIENGVLHPRRQKTAYHPELSDDPAAQALHEGDFIFADTDPDIARIYAFKTPSTADIKEFCIMKDDAGGNNKNVSVIFNTNREQYLKELAAGEPKIITIPADNTFETVNDKHGKPIGEWVSKQPLKLDQCQVEYPGGGINDLMRDGTQVLFIRDGITKEQWLEIYLKTWHKVYDDIKAGSRSSIGEEPESYMLWRKELAALIKDGTLIHENAQRGIKPFNFDTGKAAPSVAYMKSHALSGAQQTVLERAMAKRNLPDQLKL